MKRIRQTPVLLRTGFLLTASSVLLAGCGASPSAGRPSRIDRQKANSVSISISETGSTTLVYSSARIECKEGANQSDMRVSDPSGEVDYYFSVQQPTFTNSRFAMKTPTAGTYFTSAFRGRVLSWDPTLLKCDLDLIRRDSLRLAGSLDCYRTMTTAGGTRVVNIQSQFVCAIERR